MVKVLNINFFINLYERKIYKKNAESNLFENANFFNN